MQIRYVVDLPPSEKLRLQELQALAKDKTSHKDVPEADMNEMIQCLEEKRRLEMKGARSRPAAHVRDVNKIATNIGKEVCHIYGFV